jgi:GWxTD domain-containing protein
LRKIFLLFVSLAAFSIFGQKPNQNIFVDVYSIPSSDSTLQSFYYYKIPVASLIFSKDNGNYSASFQIAVEISDSNSNLILREFKDRSVIFDDFQRTIDPSTYVEGLISKVIKNRTILFTSRITDINSQKEIFSKEHVIRKYDKKESEFLFPIILAGTEIKCLEKASRVISNFGGFIPFENNPYDILIPCVDTTVDKIFVGVISQKDTIFKGLSVRKESDRIGLTECDGRVILVSDAVSSLTNNFYVTGLTNKLKEGPIEIILSNAENFENKKSFKLIVKWFNKPRSLNDPESAIRLLRFVTPEDSVLKILKGKGKPDILLNEYWKKKDPSPETEFNELMAEYYERIDYSFLNFSTITGLSGIESDRAKIYILYGNPSSIDRGSNNSRKISEIWTYSKLQKKFIFVDDKGTGEFVLKSSQ